MKGNVKFLIRLDTIDTGLSSEGIKRNKSVHLECNPATLRHMLGELQEAVDELDAANFQRMQKYISWLMNNTTVLISLNVNNITCIPLYPFLPFIGWWSVCKPTSLWSARNIWCLLASNSSLFLIIEHYQREEEEKWWSEKKVYLVYLVTITQIY